LFPEDEVVGKVFEESEDEIDDETLRQAIDGHQSQQIPGLNVIKLFFFVADDEAK
jgi:hypothetical protein